MKKRVCSPRFLGLMMIIWWIFFIIFWHFINKTIISSCKIFGRFIRNENIIIIAALDFFIFQLLLKCSVMFYHIYNIFVLGHTLITFCPHSLPLFCEVMCLPFFQSWAKHFSLSLFCKSHLGTDLATPFVWWQLLSPSATSAPPSSVQHCSLKSRDTVDTWSDIITITPGLTKWAQGN